MAMKPSKTANLLQVEMGAGTPMGIQPGTYELYISGWKWPTVDNHIQDFKIGLIIKCSGYNPAGDDFQNPHPREYGRFRSGCQPMKISFPIAHKQHF